LCKVGGRSAGDVTTHRYTANDIRAAITNIEEGLKQKFGEWETVMMNMQVKDNDLKSQLTVAKKGS
jgi:hypothetical protein